jgi:Methyladenine glycosylase
MADLHRCTWAEGDALMRAYHDEEWGVPMRESRQLWEMLMLEGFQAGLAWITVLRTRQAFPKAFAGFDPKKVARLHDGRVASRGDRQRSFGPLLPARSGHESLIRFGRGVCPVKSVTLL